MNNRPTLLKRFLCKFRVVDSGCWEWTSSIAGNGYAAIWHKGGQRIASRVSWKLFRGLIPKGLCVLHKCDNPKCVSPDHLFLGTTKDNQRDCVNKGRKANIKGVRNHMVKLAKTQVLEIRKLRTEGMKLMEIAKLFNVTIPNVSMICNRKTWSHI